MALHRFSVAIYWSVDDASFVAEVPELPGCMADGHTHEEALNNVHIIVDDWIHTALELGRSIPETKGRKSFV